MKFITARMQTCYICPVSNILVAVLEIIDEA